MLKYLIPFFAMILLLSCNQNNTAPISTPLSNDEQEHTIIQLLDSFNRAAAVANFDAYFAFYTDDAIFTGTDAAERWHKKDFMAYAKPYFDKGKAWNFTSLDRHIYFSPAGNFAWFDELLSTQMQLCRGSGVLVKTENGWKLNQYILSATIPNSMMDSVVKLKSAVEENLAQKLRNKK